MATHARRPLVLLVEDDHDIAEAVSLMLRRRGYRVERAAAGRDAIELAHELGPQVVICDLGLPDGPDGFEVAAALKADPAASRARLIAFTSFAGLDEQAREAGFEDYLVKPRDVGRLLAVVERAAPPGTPPR